MGESWQTALLIVAVIVILMTGAVVYWVTSDSYRIMKVCYSDPLVFRCSFNISVAFVDICLAKPERKIPYYDSGEKETWVRSYGFIRDILKVLALLFRACLQEKLGEEKQAISYH